MTRRLQTGPWAGTEIKATTTTGNRVLSLHSMTVMKSMEDIYSSKFSQFPLTIRLGEVQAAITTAKRAIGK